MIGRTYQNQFDMKYFNLPQEILDLKLPDISWGNDAGPSWEIAGNDGEDSFITLMVFEEKPEDREDPEFKRYTVYTNNMAIYMGDDTEEVIQLCKILRKNFLERQT